MQKTGLWKLGHRVRNSLHRSQAEPHTLFEHRCNIDYRLLIWLICVHVTAHRGKQLGQTQQESNQRSEVCYNAPAGTWLLHSTSRMALKAEDTLVPMNQPPSLWALKSRELTQHLLLGWCFIRALPVKKIILALAW